MPSNVPRVSSASVRLLILAPRRLSPGVRRAISRCAPLHWERLDQIRLVEIPDDKLHDRQYVTSQLNSASARDASGRSLLVVVDDCWVDIERLRSQIASASSDRGIPLKRFEREVLPEVLSALRLDWLSLVESSLERAWVHGVIDRQRIESWLQQFELVGHRWVGEKLLRVLDVWSSSRALESINLGDGACERFTFLCLNRSQAGKSGDALANQVQKRIRTTRISTVRDFRTCLEETTDGDVLFIEDCLLTGTEMVNVFRALLGDSRPGRIPKAQPLTNEEALRKRRIELRFAVVANWGEMTLRRFLDSRNLRNITIGIPAEGTLGTLTTDGVDALRNDRLFTPEFCLADQRRDVRKVAFDAPDVWTSAKKSNQAIDFCQTLGHQLFEQYLARKGWSWAPCRLREAALGARGNALALSFSHSVPKETLPLFWMAGNVKVERKTLKWEPLFPNAD